MVDCTFCGNAIMRGTGTIYVQKSGKILYFDKSKCEKNMLQLGRKSRNLKWTEHYVKAANKEEIK